jgi:hypothetical protein
VAPSGVRLDLAAPPADRDGAVDRRPPDETTGQDPRGGRRREIDGRSAGQLVAAPTTLGASRAGRDAAGVHGTGMEPVDVPLERELDISRRAVRLGLNGKTNVVATWGPSRPGARSSSTGTSTW